MSNLNYTYRMKLIMAGIVIWELIFWGILLVTLTLLGYFSTAPSEKIGFKTPQLLWFLTLLIPAFLLYFRSLRRTNLFAEKIPLSARNMMLRPVSSLNSLISFLLFRNAYAFLVLSLAQPVYGTKKVSATLESLELVVCLDVSNSMNTKDISPTDSRLQIAKRALNQLVNNLHGEKIGVCVFAGGAYVQLPLTSDYSAAKLFINEIETNMFSNQGTNIAEALETASTMFSAQKTTKGILIVTDGENHEKDPGELLKKIREKQIQFAVLGIGTPSGGPVPIDPYRPELGYKRTAAGSTVVSKINPAFLKDLAEKGEGKLTLASTPFPEMTGILTQINQMKRTRIKDLEFDIRENRYQIPLFAALIFWLTLLVFRYRNNQSTIRTT